MTKLNISKMEYSETGSVPEGITVHLAGAQETNYPWGFENRLIPTLEKIGCKVISTDYRKNRKELHRLLREPADLLLVCRGEGIPPGLVRSVPCTTALWYAEQIGTVDRFDSTAEQRRRELSFNAPAFDYVFSHDGGNLDVYRQLGCTQVGCLPTACVDPSTHYKLDLSKEFDVVFVGSQTPRREQFLRELERHIPVHAPQVWDVQELNRLFNQSRIVLNLHLSDLLNTETRVCEVTGAGAFLLTETLSMPDYLEDGKHAVVFETGDVMDCLAKIEYYLKHEDERETIAAAGYARVQNGEYTHEDRLRTMLAGVDLSLKRRVWPGVELGVTRDKWGQPTTRVSDFYAAVEQQLFRDGVPIASIQPLCRPYSITTLSSRFEDCGPQNAPRCLHIFTAFRHVNWEDYNLLPALEALGEVLRFNWHPAYNQYDPQWHLGGKQRMNIELLQAVQAAHNGQPIDVFFGYLSGRTVFPGIVRAIGMMGIPTLNICLDDKAKFYGNLELSGFAGMADIANAFSLCWTSTREAVAFYESVGARAIYMPPGANPHVFHPYDMPRDIDVCFVGQKYGQRSRLIAYLREQRINVQTFGRGWDSEEIPMEEMVRLFSRSKITLGVGTVGNSTDEVCIKGRDFEVPMSGGFYLTQYNHDLEEFYEIGKEIVCYSSQDDLVEKIRHYLTHPEEAEEIRQAGLQRARRDHSWVGRFRQAFSAMGINMQIEERSGSG